MDIKIDPPIMEDVILITADSSGIKVTNSGERLSKKWYVRGFIKMLSLSGREKK